MRLLRIALTTAVIGAFAVPFAAAWVAAYDGKTLDVGETALFRDPHADGQWTVLAKLPGGRIKIRKGEGGPTRVVAESELLAFNRW